MLITGIGERKRDGVETLLTGEAAAAPPELCSRTALNPARRLHSARMAVWEDGGSHRAFRSAERVTSKVALQLADWDPAAAAPGEAARLGFGKGEIAAGLSNWRCVTRDSNSRYHPRCFV